MKPLVFHISALAGCCLIFSNGCCTKKDGTPIADGLYQIGQGLARMRMGELDTITNKVFLDRGETNFTTGLFATEFSYTFNVSSSKYSNNALTIAATASVPQIPVSGSLSDAYSAGQASQRANQITLNFASPYFTTTTIVTTNKTTVGTNTVVAIETKTIRTITPPDQLKAFFKVVYGKEASITPSGGVTPFFQ